MAQRRGVVDLAAVLAERRFAEFHAEVLALCAVAFFVAGFDAGIMAPAATAIVRALFVEPGAFDGAASWNGVGIFCGLLAATFGDRAGRRRAINTGLLICGIASLATMFAMTATAILALRFVTGFGIGLILPNGLALPLEVMPARHRLGQAGLVWFCFAFGAAAPPPLVGMLLPRWPWQSAFLVAGLLPVVAALVLWGRLAESPYVLLRRGDSGGVQLRATMTRISRRYDRLPTAVTFASGEDKENGDPVPLLFGRRNGTTVLLWLLLVAAALATFLFAARVPTFAARPAFGSEADKIERGAVAAAALGVLPLAYFADFRDRFRLLIAAFGLAIVAVVVVELRLADGPATIAASFFLAGALGAAIVCAAANYPSTCRATGAGAALAAAWLGQLLAPAIVAPLGAGSTLAAVALFAIAAAAVAFRLSERA